MSQHARDAFLRSLVDADTADHTERRWMEGDMITAKDLKRGGKTIERCTAAEWFGSAKHRDSKPAATKGQKGGPLVISFGKHRGKLAADVMVDDPGYWSWCMREVAWFAKAAAEAGLTSDEP